MLLQETIGKATFALPGDIFSGDILHPSTCPAKSNLLLESELILVWNQYIPTSFMLYLRNTARIDQLHSSAPAYYLILRKAVDCTDDYYTRTA